MALSDITGQPQVQAAIEAALAEDVGSGDVTTLSLVDPQTRVEAVILAREACVVSGLDVAREILLRFDPRIALHVEIPDGGTAAADDVIARLRGRAQAVLTGERVALNFMQRMCGVATLTRRFVDKVRHLDVAILDTRKTTPALRIFEKYAVLCGGGQNHRMGLYDRVLIKDNHRRLWRGGDPTELDKAVAAARAVYPDTMVEVEVETLTELRTVLQANPEWVLLDNMSPAQMAECVQMCAGRTKTEASGGITLETIEAVAAAGVDAVSLGCLTHSAPAIDISLEIETALGDA